MVKLNRATNKRGMSHKKTPSWHICLQAELARLRTMEAEWVVDDWITPYTILALLPVVGAKKRPIHRISHYLWMEVIKMLRRPQGDLTGD